MDYDLVPSQLKLNELPSNERRQLSIVCVCVCVIFAKVKQFPHK